jgi:cell division protease FtsH
MQRALAILQQNRDKLEQGAKALLEKETLTADELPKPQVELTGGGWRGQGSAGRQALPRVMP